jgi:hypothetical protein
MIQASKKKAQIADRKAKDLLDLITGQNRFKMKIKSI